MIRKQDIWDRPEESKTANEHERAVLLWKQKVWDTIPEVPKNENWDFQFKKLITDLKADVETVTDERKIFNLTDYLIDKGVIRTASWRLYAPSTAGTGMNFDQSNDVFHVPSNGQEANKDAHAVKFGMESAESSVDDYEFISTEDQDLRIYCTKDGYSRKYLFERGTDIYTDPGNIFDKFDNNSNVVTLCFYQGCLIKIFDCNINEAKKRVKSQIKKETNTSTLYNTSFWKKEALTRKQIIGEKVTVDDIKNTFGFKDVKVSDELNFIGKTYDKALDQFYKINADIAHALGISKEDMSLHGKISTDISIETMSLAAENWFLNFIKNLNKNQFRELIEPFLEAVKYIDGQPTSLKNIYDSYEDSITIPLIDYRKYGSKENMMMAKTFAWFVSHEANKKGIMNDFVNYPQEAVRWKRNLEHVAYPDESDIMLVCSLSLAGKNMIKSAIRLGILNEEKISPIEEVTIQLGTKKHEKNIFMSEKKTEVNNAEQTSGPRM